MRALVAGLAVVGLLAVVGCGGGGGDNDCGDVANKIYACAVSLGAGGEVDREEIQAGCEAVTCDEKQAALDCIMALSCSEDIEGEAFDCVYDNGCAVPVIRQ